jgi:hypothetical protein
MKVFHRTPFAESILEHGFRDGEGTYLTGTIHKGVWVSDRPLDISEGANGRDLLCLEIPDDVVEPFEWIEEGKPCREFLTPAEIVNSYGPPDLCDEDDYDS